MPIDKFTGKNRNWFKEEEDIIRTKYPNTPTKEVLEELSMTIEGLSENALRSKALKMKVRKTYNTIKENIPENTKYCPKCNTIKDLATGFYPRVKGTNSDYNSYCKECSSIIAKEKRLKEKISKHTNDYEKIRIKERLHANGQTNKCLKCGQTYPANLFEINYATSKLVNVCRSCRRVQQRDNRLNRILKGKEW